MKKDEFIALVVRKTFLSSAALAEIEMFFADHEDIDIRNYQSVLDEWRESEAGKRANTMIQQVIDAEKDEKIKYGLTAIERGNYSYVNSARGRCLGTYVVYDRITRLRGLITENEEEVLPCILDDISVHLDGYTDVTFKNKQYTIDLLASRVNRHSIAFSYKNGGSYVLRPNKKRRDQKTGKVYTTMELDEVTQQFIDLLNVHHSYQAE